MEILDRKVQTSVSLKLSQLQFVKSQNAGWLSRKVQELIDKEMRAAKRNGNLIGLN